MSDPKKPKINRRWMRISLRFFLVLFALFSLGLAYWVRPALDQRRAVKDIKSMGGKVIYDTTRIDPEQVVLRRPGWLERKLGIDFLCPATEVRISGAKWDNRKRPFDFSELAACLKRLPKLRSLEFNEAGLWDKDLAEIATCSDRLESLSISDSDSVSSCGAGLVHIKNWPRLTSLRFECDYYRSLDLSSLSTCPLLDELWIGAGKLGEKDFVAIASCTELVELNLGSCSFDGEHLRHLQKASSLKSLVLTNCAPRYMPSGLPDGEQGSYHFKGGDPSYVPPIAEEFRRYGEWQEQILPGVSYHQLFEP